MSDSESSEGREEGKGYASSSHDESSPDTDFVPSPSLKTKSSKKRKYRPKVTKVDGSSSKQATPSGSKVHKKSSKPSASKQKQAKRSSTSKAKVSTSSRSDARDSASDSGEDVPFVDDGSETNEDNALSILSSSITETEVQRMRNSFAIPENIDIIIPGSQEYIWSPPPGYLSMCVESFLYGFRVPIPSFLEKFFCKLQICPTQMNPLSMGSIIAWLVLMRKRGFPLTVKNFSRFFIISRYPKNSFYYVSPTKNRHFMGLVGSSLGKAHVWKARYVYLRYVVDPIRPSPGFRVPRKWLRDSIDLNQFKTRHIPSWCKGYENVHKVDYVPPNLCLVEPILRLAGISSIDPPGGFRGCKDLDWWMKLSCRILRKSYVEQLGKATNQKESSVVAKHEVKGPISVLNLCDIFDPVKPPKIIKPYNPAKKPAKDFSKIIPVMSAPMVDLSVVVNAVVASSEVPQVNMGEQTNVVANAAVTPSEVLQVNMGEQTNVVANAAVAEVVVPVVAEAAVNPVIRVAPSTSLIELRDWSVEDSSDSSGILVRKRKLNPSDLNVSSKRHRADDDDDDDNDDQQVTLSIVTHPPVLPEAGVTDIVTEAEVTDIVIVPPVLPEAEVTNVVTVPPVLPEAEVTRVETTGGSSIQELIIVSQVEEPRFEVRSSSSGSEQKLFDELLVAVSGYREALTDKLHQTNVELQEAQQKDVELQEARATIQMLQGELEKNKDSEQRIIKAEHRAVAAEQRAIAAEQLASVQQNRADTHRIRVDELTQLLIIQREDHHQIHIALNDVMVNNKTLSEQLKSQILEYHDLQVGCEDNKMALALAEQRALTAVDDMLQLKAELTEAKLTGAREFKASPIFKILAPRAAGESSSAAVDIAPDPSDPYYSLLDDQACNISGSRDADPRRVPNESGSSGINQFYLAGGSGDPSRVELRYVDPSGVILDTSAEAGISGVNPDASADTGPPLEAS